MTQPLKPADLVYCKRPEDYTCIAQVISHPMPDGKIVVRMVPENAGTAETVPLSSVKLARRSDYRWVHYAIVSGDSEFPVDMLRYDCAAPVNFTLDMDEVGRVQTVLKPSVITGLYRNPNDHLVVAKVARCAKPLPWTIARWESFEWTVQPIPPPIRIGA